MLKAERKAVLLGRDSPTAASTRRKRRKGGARNGGGRKAKPKTFADAARLVQMAKRIGTKTIQNLQQPQLPTNLAAADIQSQQPAYQLEQIQCTSLDKTAQETNSP